MSLVKNRDLDQSGVNTETHPVKLPLNALTDALNIRFDSGSIVTRKGDIETMKTPSTIPLNLKEVDGVWYWGSSTDLWEYERETGLHLDKTRREYPKEDALLGNVTETAFINGIDWAGLRISFKGTKFEQQLVDGLMFVGQTFNGLRNVTSFTIASIVGEGEITFTTSETDETTFREDFSAGLIFNEAMATTEGAPPLIEYYVGDINISLTNGIDWGNQIATFRGVDELGRGTYYGEVGGEFQIGMTFLGRIANPDLVNMFVSEIIDSHTFKFTTTAANETLFRDSFASPFLWDGLDNKDAPLGEIPYSENPGLSYWEFTPYGSAIVASNESNVPQIRTANWGGEANYFYDLPKWGVEGFTLATEAPAVEWRTKVIRAYSQFLLAINMTHEDAVEGLHAGGAYPQRVRWSSAAQPNQAPSSWNGATLETNAGWVDLSGVTGELIDGFPYRDSFILFTENEVIEMRFVGGDQIFVWDVIFNDGGLLARNCVVEFKGKQFCIGPNDIYIHDTSSKTSVAVGKVKQRLFDEISNTDTNNVRCFHNELNEEIWVMYSDNPFEGGGDFPLNKAAVWNYNNLTWTFFTLDDASGIDVGVRPPEAVSTKTQWDSPESSVIPWDDTKTPWQGRKSGFGNQGIVYSSIGLSEDGTPGKFMLCDSVETSTDEHPERFIEKIGIDLNSVGQGDSIEQWVYLNRILPIITAVDGARVRVLVSGSETQHKRPNFVVEDSDGFEVGLFPGVDEYIIDPSLDYRIDVRQSWSYLAYRMEFLDPTHYEIHAIDFECKPRDKR